MSYSFDAPFAMDSQGDYFSKYLVGAICVMGAAYIALSPRLLAHAIALGCWSSMVVALWQFPEMGRAEGFTNAIRFGNLSLLMAALLWVLAMAQCFSWREKLWLMLSGLAGVVASILSLSRGGWLLVFVLPWCFAFFVQGRRARQKIAGVIAGVALVFAVILSVTPMAQNRIATAAAEVAGYVNNRDAFAGTSVGARLEQWHLAWNLGWDKPWTGWGVNGVEQGRMDYLQRGEAHPSIVKIHHAHNEFLEMWATRGVSGVLMLLLFYAVPLYIFWPCRRKLTVLAPTQRSMFQCLSVAGVLLPLGYFVFGWTDVFFKLGIGHNFFVFSCAFIMASLQWVQRQGRHGDHAEAGGQRC